MIPDPGIPRLGRWHVAWALVMLVWAVTTVLLRGVIDTWALEGYHRLAVIGISLPLYWLSGNRIFDWGRR